MSDSSDSEMPCLTSEQVRAVLDDLMTTSQSSSAELPAVGELLALNEESSELIEDPVDNPLETLQTFCEKLPNALVEPGQDYMYENSDGNIEVISDMGVSPFVEDPHDGTHQNIDGNVAALGEMGANATKESPHDYIYQDSDGNVVLLCGMDANAFDEAFHAYRCQDFNRVVAGSNSMDANASHELPHTNYCQDSDGAVADSSGMSTNALEEPPHTEGFIGFDGTTADLSVIDPNAFDEAFHAYKCRDFNRVFAGTIGMDADVSHESPHANIYQDSDGAAEGPSGNCAETFNRPHQRGKCQNSDESDPDVSRTVLKALKQQLGIVPSRTPSPDTIFFQCEVCADVFTSEVDLRTHQSNRGIPIACDIGKCWKVFCSRRSHEIHVSRFHYCYPCEKCGKFFEEETMVKSHCCFDDPIWKCQICQATFTAFKDWFNHKKSHK